MTTWAEYPRSAHVGDIPQLPLPVFTVAVVAFRLNAENSGVDFVAGSTFRALLTVAEREEP